LDQFNAEFYEWLLLLFGIALDIPDTMTNSMTLSAAGIYHKRMACHPMWCRGQTFSGRRVL